MPVEHNLPSERSLFIATPSAIHLRSQAADKIVFECEGVDGIINARASTDNSSLLAVADSQVVILHDIRRQRDKKHKPKGGDVSQTDSHCNSWQTDFSQGSTMSSFVLARLAHALLYHNVEYIDTGLLATDWQSPPFDAASPFSAKRRSIVERRQRSAISFILTTHCTTTGSEMGQQRARQPSAGRHAISRQLCSLSSRRWTITTISYTIRTWFPGWHTSDIPGLSTISVP